MSINKSFTSVPGKQPAGNIARHAGIIGIATLCSRILGFIRDIVIARVFGIYIYAQAFVVAFKIPNLFRDFLGEGATNAAFVPVLSEYAYKGDRREFWEVANILLNLLLVVLMALVLIGVSLAPVIVRMIAPGFIGSEEKLEATVKLSRMIFPYILLVSLSAYSMGILNTLRHFSVPAFAPCLLNISLIVFALMWGEGIKGLAAGVLVGGVLQLVVQIPVLYKKGMRLRLRSGFSHPAVKSIFRLMIPRVASSSIYQLNNFVDSIFGSLSLIVGEGGVAALYFAYRLILFPLGIFSNSLSQVMLPEFSRQVLDKEHKELNRALSYGLRATFLVMLPASAGLLVLSEAITNGLFAGGRFDAYSVGITSGALFYYSIGLFAYGSTKILNSCFFAMKDTLTPAKVSALALVINVVFNSILMFPMKLNGLALSTSISGIVTFIVSLHIIKARLSEFELRPIAVSFFKMLAASIIMALVCRLSLFVRINTDIGMLRKALMLGIPIIAGVVSYCLLCLALKIDEIKGLLRWLKLKKH